MPPELPSETFHAAFAEQIQKLKNLVQALPNTIPIATEKDCVKEIFTKFPAVDAGNEDYWMVFNHCMDALFGEDVRNSNGCLQNIMRGRFGMDMVISYLKEAISLGHLQWAAAQPKFMCLIDELQYLVYDNSFAIYSRLY